MTNLRPYDVKGSCGHTFTVVLPSQTRYDPTPGYIDALLSGNICFEKCPTCNEEVPIYIGFVLNTLHESIGIYPDIWRESATKFQAKYDTIIFEEYGKPFDNLKKHLFQKGVITENGRLTGEHAQFDGPRAHLMEALHGGWYSRKKKVDDGRRKKPPERPPGTEDEGEGEKAPGTSPAV